MQAAFDDSEKPILKHIHTHYSIIKCDIIQLPGVPVVRNSPANARDNSSIPGSGRSPGEGHGNPLQCYCLENTHGRRSLVGCSPWACKKLDMTEQLSRHTYNNNRISGQCVWFNTLYYLI